MNRTRDLPIDAQLNGQADELPETPTTPPRRFFNSLLELRVLTWASVALNVVVLGILYLVWSRLEELVLDAAHKGG